MKNQNPLFTDEMQLPIYDAIKNLPRWDGMPGFTQTRAQVLGAEGKNGAQADAAREGSKAAQASVNEGVSRRVARGKADREMERAKGFEPSTLTLAT